MPDVPKPSNAQCFHCKLQSGCPGHIFAAFVGSSETGFYISSWFSLDRLFFLKCPYSAATNRALWVKTLRSKFGPGPFSPACLRCFIFFHSLGPDLDSEANCKAKGCSWKHETHLAVFSQAKRITLPLATGSLINKDFTCYTHTNMYI